MGNQSSSTNDGGENAEEQPSFSVTIREDLMTHLSGKMDATSLRESS